MKQEVQIFIDDVTLKWGTEKAVINLANNLSKHGYKVIITSLYSFKGSSVFNLSDKVTVNHLGVNQLEESHGPLSKILHIFKIERAFSSQINRQRSILIGTNTIINSLLVITKLRRALIHKKIFGCEHLPFNMSTTFLKKMRSIFYRYLNKIVVLTLSDAEKYTIRGYKNVEVIPNEVSDIPSNFAWPRQKTIISVGRLSEEKGFDTLINDITPLLQKYSDWKLEIYGEGQCRDKLLELITMNGMQGRIFLPGYVENIRERYDLASIYVMTSRFEAFGMVLVEAQLSGMPIVAYDCESGPREIIDHGKNGFLIPLKDSKYFRSKIQDLMLNDDLRFTMGKSALTSVRRFDSQNIFNLWNAILAEEVI